MNILIYKNNYFVAGTPWGNTLEKANILKTLFVPIKSFLRRNVNNWNEKVWDCLKNGPEKDQRF